MASRDNDLPGGGRAQHRVLPKKVTRVLEYCRAYYQSTFGTLGKPKMVFVWIPKTAGTSLFSALEKEVGMVNLCRSLSHVKLFRNRGAVTFGHFDYRALLSAGYVSQDFDRAAFKFCVVRDPYDRALSLYFYLKRIGRFDADFVDFLHEVSKNRPPIGLYNSTGISQANPQVDWIADEKGEIFVDKIYRLEDMEKMVEDLTRMFQLKELDIGHQNRTGRDRPADDILLSHEDVIPLIEEIYARDFDLLGYAKRRISG